MKKFNKDLLPREKNDLSNLILLSTYITISGDKSIAEREKFLYFIAEAADCQTDVSSCFIEETKTTVTIDLQKLASLINMPGNFWSKRYHVRKVYEKI